MASAVAGRGGSVKLNGTPVTTVAQVDTWNGTLTEVLLDQTALGDLWTSDVPGLQSFTGSIAGNWAVTGDPGQTTLHNAVLNKVTVGLNLLVNSTARLRTDRLPERLRNLRHRDGQGHVHRELPQPGPGVLPLMAELLSRDAFLSFAGQLAEEEVDVPGMGSGSLPRTDRR